MARKSTPRSVELGARRTPVQERAIRARAHILHVAAELLEEVGLDAFNTNLLAEKADVRVRTVYRYFPNKLAVIAAIGEELIDKWSDWNSAHLEVIATPDADWRARLARMIDEWFGNVSHEKGGWAVLQAMGAIPQLRDLDRIAFTRIAARWEHALRTRAPHLGEDATALSFAIVSTFYGFIDSYLRVPLSHRAQIAGELKAMVGARLAPVLDARPARTAI